MWTYSNRLNCVRQTCFVIRFYEYTTDRTFTFSHLKTGARHFMEHAFQRCLMFHANDRIIAARHADICLRPLKQDSLAKREIGLVWRPSFRRTSTLEQLALSFAEAMDETSD